MAEMSFQEKAAALNALSPIAIKMRGINDWFVAQSTEIGASDSGVLTGSYGNGIDPMQAIEDHWTILTSIKPPQYIVLQAMSPEKRGHFRWNGYMWKSLPLPEPPKD